MDLVIFVSFIIISAALLMIRGELRDIARSLYKIAKHFEQIDEKDEN